MIGFALVLLAWAAFVVLTLGSVAALLFFLLKKRRPARQSDKNPPPIAHPD